MFDDEPGRPSGCKRGHLHCWQHRHRAQACSANDTGDELEPLGGVDRGAVDTCGLVDTLLCGFGLVVAEESVHFWIGCTGDRDTDDALHVCVFGLIGDDLGRLSKEVDSPLCRDGLHVQAIDNYLCTLEGLSDSLTGVDINAGAAGGS